ncbi:MAG TPA: GNAT family N-acetyltransferase [Pyrinomonadaceae bacterium]|nr:GNAT family N-acetyltransferase [Pyrinomonadaceae bacterium]
MKITTATEADAPAIAALRTSVAEDLTRQFGKGHWSSCATEKSVLRSIKTSRVLVACDDGEVIGTLSLQTKKPWAIDLSYFKIVGRPLHLLDMAVSPDRQRRGIGRQLIEEATAVARAWPSEAIRLDAYDSDAGAGPFYAKCGFTEVGRKSYRGVPLVYFELML